MYSAVDSKIVIIIFYMNKKQYHIFTFQLEELDTQRLNNKANGI